MNSDLDAPIAASIDQTAQLDARRNVFAFGTDIFSWNLGTFIVPVTTILAALAAKLTEDRALVGLVGLAWSAGWALPQLLGARLIHGKPRKLKYVIWSGVVGRQWFLVLALWLLFTGAVSKPLTFLLLLVCVAVFALADGVASVAWFDVLAKTITSRTRTRLFATVTFAATIVALLANGLVVRNIFESPLLPFPLNFGYVILIGWVFIFISFLGITAVREPADPPLSAATDSHIGFFSQLTIAIRTDLVFRKLLVARLLTAFEVMAAQFYIVFAQDRLKISDAVIGDFSTAYTVGSLIGVLALGSVADKFGSRRVIQGSSFFQFIAPAIAFGTAVLLSTVDTLQWLGLWAMIVVQGINGLVNHSMMLGFLNYTLDVAPTDKRPMYVGTLNLLYGLMGLTPPLGGLLIDVFSRSGSQTTGYAVLFGGVCLTVLVGLWVTSKLPKHGNAEFTPI